MILIINIVLFMIIRESSVFHGRSAEEQKLQINPETGISLDYMSRFHPIISWYNFGGLSTLKNQALKKPFRAEKYSDLYSQYKEAVNESNKDRVAALDALADRINEILSNPDNIDEDLLEEAIEELSYLIYNDNRASLKKIAA